VNIFAAAVPGLPGRDRLPASGKAISARFGLDRVAGRRARLWDQGHQRAREAVAAL